MATYVEITDPTDPRLADYRNLRDVKMRQSLEAEHGLFLAEGEKVVRRATAAGFPVRSFLMAPRWLEGLAAVIDATEAPCYVLAESLAEEVTGFHVHRGALASLVRTPLPSVEEVLEGARTVVVCEDIVDHTNIGAIFRNAAALGVDGVLLAPRCADPLYRRSIKVAMGAVFASPGPGCPTGRRAAPDAVARLHHRRPHARRGRRSDRRGRRRTRQGRARARLRGARPVRPLGAVGAAGRGHPDAARDRLAERGRGHGRRLL